MRTMERFMAVMAVCFFVGAIVSAWRVAVAGGVQIGYVPLVLACASAGMTLGALRGRKIKTK